MSGDRETLFLRGLPGSGKTLLMSNLIHHLQGKLAMEDSVGLAYVYCNFRRKGEQTPIHIFSSVLKQLSQARDPLPEPVKSLYKSHNKTQSRSLLEEIIATMCSVIEELSRCFIVIDALDELELQEYETAPAKTIRTPKEDGAQLYRYFAR
jgi:Cdc6-like AAA superfamily ATPase